MKKSLFIAVLVLFVTSCSPKIVGTWNVDRYEVDNYKGQNFTTTNAGEIVMKKNGKGEKNLYYNMFNKEATDLQSFRWNLQDQILRIYDVDSEKEKKTDFANSWIVVTNKKNKQVWRSTDGSTVQTIELSK